MVFGVGHVGGRFSVLLKVFASSTIAGEMNLERFSRVETLRR